MPTFEEIERTLDANVVRLLADLAKVPDLEAENARLREELAAAEKTPHS